MPLTQDRRTESRLSVQAWFWNQSSGLLMVLSVQLLAHSSFDPHRSTLLSNLCRQKCSWVIGDIFFLVRRSLHRMKIQYIQIQGTFQQHVRLIITVYLKKGAVQWAILEYTLSWSFVLNRNAPIRISGADLQSQSWKAESGDQPIQLGGSIDTCQPIIYWVLPLLQCKGCCVFLRSTLHDVLLGLLISLFWDHLLDRSNPNLYLFITSF